MLSFDEPINRRDCRKGNGEFIEKSHIQDDRDNVTPLDRSVLIVDDDAKLSQILLDIAREGKTQRDRVTYGRADHPHGPTVQALRHFIGRKAAGYRRLGGLDRLKHDEETRHIPVFILSGKSGKRKKALKLGAFEYLEKPDKEQLSTILKELKVYTDKRTRQILVVEDDDVQRQSVAELVGQGADVEVTAVPTAEEALRMMREKTYDCVILDLLLPDTTGYDLLQRMEESQLNVPVIIYTGADLTHDQQSKLRRTTQTVIIKIRTRPSGCSPRRRSSCIGRVAAYPRISESSSKRRARWIPCSRAKRC